MSNSGLTIEEEEIMNHTIEIWNRFVKLSVQHPSDIQELQSAVHQIQQLIAIRSLRRNNPDYWTTSSYGDGKIG